MRWKNYGILEYSPEFCVNCATQECPVDISHRKSQKDTKLQSRKVGRMQNIMYDSV